MVVINQRNNIGKSPDFVEIDNSFYGFSLAEIEMEGFISENRRVRLLKPVSQQLL